MDHDDPGSRGTGVPDDARGALAVLEHDEVEVLPGQKFPERLLKTVQNPLKENAGQFRGTRSRIGDADFPDFFPQSVGPSLPFPDRIQQGNILIQSREGVDIRPGSEGAAPVSGQVIVCDDQDFHRFLLFHSRTTVSRS